MAYLSDRMGGGCIKGKDESKLKNKKEKKKKESNGNMYVQGEASTPPKTASRADIRPRPR